MSDKKIELSRSAHSVQEVLAKKGLNFKVVELLESTRTAEDAAKTIGCDVAQIIKSLVFRTKETKKPVLILVSGVNRVNEGVISQLIGEKIEKADAGFVREVTGFAIGGIPPVGHAQIIETLIDEDLLQHNYLWAAAGTPHAVFRINSAELVGITDGRVVEVV